jgi:Uma2 family endonuclease
MATSPLRAKRWTRAEYERLIDAGVFPSGEPIELIGGGLIVAEPQASRHFTAIARTAKTLEAAFGPGWVVRQQGPIALDDESEPEPDIAVVAGTIDDYREAHPARPVLVVEVAESSLSMDREHKGSLYARAGLADYWIVNLVDEVVEIYRQPARDLAAPFGWRYASRDMLAPSAWATPLAAPAARVAVSSLLP